MLYYTEINEDIILKTTKKDANCVEQRNCMKKLDNKKKIVGEYWYCIHKHWYEKWLKYTEFNTFDLHLNGGVKSLLLRENLDKLKPGKITNYLLQEKSNSLKLNYYTKKDIFKIVSNWVRKFDALTWTQDWTNIIVLYLNINSPKLLSKKLSENVTHVWIHKYSWKLLHLWYGGGPAFPRKVIARGYGIIRKKIKYIDMYPKYVQFLLINEKTGKVNQNNIIVKSFSQFFRDFTLEEAVEELEEEYGQNNGKKYGLDDIIEYDSMDENTPKIHLWTKFKYIRHCLPVQTNPINKKDAIILHSKDFNNENEERLCEIPDDFVTDFCTKAKCNNDTIFIIERKINNKWQWYNSNNNWNDLKTGDILDVKDSYGKWYESVIRCVKNNSFAVHFIGWANKFDRWIKMDESSDRFALRGTHTKGPYRKNRSSSESPEPEESDDSQLYDSEEWD